MNSNYTYFGYFAVYISQVIMLYTLNLYYAVNYMPIKWNKI